MRALNTEEQDHRKRKVLHYVIQEYVRTGKPVGSQVISSSSLLDNTEKLELLLAKDSRGFSGLYCAMTFGHTKTVQTYVREVLNSRLSGKVKSELVWAGLCRALEGSHAAAALAYSRALTGSYFLDALALKTGLPSSPISLTLIKSKQMFVDRITELLEKPDDEITRKIHECLRGILNKAPGSGEETWGHQLFWSQRDLRLCRLGAGTLGELEKLAVRFGGKGWRNHPFPEGALEGATEEKISPKLSLVTGLDVMGLEEKKMPEGGADEEKGGPE